MPAAVNLSIKNQYVEPLYNCIVHMDLPNLFFVGLPVSIIGFNTFHVQAQYISALLNGVAMLPSSEQMYSELEYLKSRGLLEPEVTRLHIILLHSFFK